MINYSLAKAFVFLNRLNETQYKCSQGDPFEKVGGGGKVGVCVWLASLELSRPIAIRNAAN